MTGPSLCNSGAAPIGALKQQNRKGFRFQPKITKYGFECMMVPKAAELFSNNLPHLEGILHFTVAKGNFDKKDTAKRCRSSNTLAAYAIRQCPK